MLLIFKSLHIYHLILFSKVTIYVLLNISVKNHKKIFCHKEFYWYMFLCQNSEGVHPYLLKCCRGTCSYAGMVKGYILRKRIGTPALVIRYLARQVHSNINKLFSERTPSLLFINLTCEWLF